MECMLGAMSTMRVGCSCCHIYKLVTMLRKESCVSMLVMRTRNLFFSTAGCGVSFRFHY